MSTLVASWEQALPGWGQAFNSLLLEQGAMDRIEQCVPSSGGSRQEGDLRDADGALYVLPENQPAVYLWLYHLCEQWDRDGFGNIVAFRSGIALEFARELAARDHTLLPLRLVEDIAVIARTAMPLLQKHQQEQSKRIERQQKNRRRA